MTRLAVITADRVRVMEGRRLVALYEASNVTAELVEEARVAPEAPLEEPQPPRRPTVGFYIPAWGRLQ